MNHLERSPLFRKKENTQDAGDPGSDEVCDRLRLAGAWRALNDQVLPRKAIENGAALGAVGVPDKKRSICGLHLDVDVTLRCTHRLHCYVAAFISNLSEQPLDYWVNVWSLSLRPIRRVQVLVHQYLAELQQGERNMTANPPLRLRFNEIGRASCRERV